ncbi:hypothetical protein B0H13DRAFT_2347633 [Mycena leptocephala]|nr:hypothetical protein B0H13DRAFT_2347633 [Mycena leptocephala]
MFFAPSAAVALIASILPLAAALAVPNGYTSVTTANVSSLAATSRFVIASAQFGTELNIGYSNTSNGNAVILYGAGAAQSTNQQWILNNVIGSPTEYTIQSAEAPAFLSFPGAGSSALSFNGQTVVDDTCYPTFTIRQYTPGVNGYLLRSPYLSAASRSILAQLRTDFSALNYHHFRCRLALSPACEASGAAKETRAHFLLHCPAWDHWRPPLQHASYSACVLGAVDVS